MVYRSNLHIYAQVIDDNKSRTLVSSSSNDKELVKSVKKTKGKKDKTIGNKVNYKIESLEEGQNMLVNIPKNFFEDCHEKKDVFDNKLSENRKYEQYFWTSKTVKDLLDACEFGGFCF